MTLGKIYQVEVKQTRMKWFLSLEMFDQTQGQLVKRYLCLVLSESKLLNKPEARRRRKFPQCLNGVIEVTCPNFHLVCLCQTVMDFVCFTFLSLLLKWVRT